MKIGQSVFSFSWFFLPFRVFSLLGREEGKKGRKEGSKQASKQAVFVFFNFILKPKWQPSVGKCRKSGNRP
jgi:hypothetical protein